MRVCRPRGAGPHGGRHLTSQGSQKRRRRPDRGNPLFWRPRLTDIATAVPSRAVALLSLAAFASAATTRICDGLLPQIAADLQVSTGAAAQVITAYSASYGLFQIVYGLLGDRFGKTRAIVLGCVLSIATTLACAAATTLPQLITARLLAGITASGIIPLSLAWIGDAVPYEGRQGLIARFITGQIAGVIIGLAFGGAIGEAFGWRAAFYLIAGAYVAATIGLVLQFRTALATETRRKSAGALATLRSVLQRAWVRQVLLMTFLEGFLCFGALAFVAATLHTRFGLSFTAAGSTLAVFGLGGLLYASFAPKIVPRLGEAGGARLSAVFFALAFSGYALMPTAAFAIPASFCAGIGYYCLHNVLQVNATQMAPDARGAAVALFATAFFVGQGFGVAAAAPIVDRFGPVPVFAAAALLLPACALVFARALASKPRTDVSLGA